jgi:hypothetical protein
MILILIVGLAVLYLGIFAIVLVIAYKKVYSWKKLVFIVLTIIFLGFGDNILGNIVFYTLCTINGGERIYQTVDNVPGFMIVTDYGDAVANYVDDLINGRYQFIEEKVTLSNNYFNMYFAQKEGLYRFYVDTIGTTKCDEYVHYMSHPSRKGKISDKCMASEVIDRPRSKYSVYLDKIEIEAYLEPIINVRGISTVINEIETNRVIAKSSHYYYAGGWLKRGLFGYMKAKAFPNGEYTTTEKKEFIHKVLRSDKK